MRSVLARLERCTDAVKREQLRAILTQIHTPSYYLSSLAGQRNTADVCLSPMSLFLQQQTFLQQQQQQQQQQQRTLSHTQLLNVISSASARHCQQQETTLLYTTGQPSACSIPNAAETDSEPIAPASDASIKDEVENDIVVEDGDEALSRISQQHLSCVVGVQKNDNPPASRHRLENGASQQKRAI